MCLENVKFEKKAHHEVKELHMEPGKLWYFPPNRILKHGQSSFEKSSNCNFFGIGCGLLKIRQLLRRTCVIEM